MASLLQNSCPSLPVLLLIIANPLHMSALVTVVAWYTTVSTGDYETCSKSLKRSDAYKNVGGSLPITTASGTVYKNTLVWIAVTLFSSNPNCLDCCYTILHYTLACSIYIIQTGYTCCISFHTDSCMSCNDHIDNT